MAERHRRDREPQTLAFPTRAREKQRNFARLNLQLVTGFFPQLRVETKLLERNAIADDIDLLRGIAIQIDNLAFDHLRIDDNSARAAIYEESFFELQNVAMLTIQPSNKSLQRHFKCSFASQPGTMDTVAGTVNVTTPEALEAHQEIAANLRSHLL